MNRQLLKDLREIRGSQPHRYADLDRDQLLAVIGEHYRHFLARDGSHAQVIANVRATDHPHAAMTADRLDAMFSDGSPNP